MASEKRMLIPPQLMPYLLLAFRQESAVQQAAH